MARKAGRKVSGRLVKRGKVWYCRWRVEGQEFSRRLTDEAGNPVTNERAARAAADRLLAPYQARDIEDLRRAAAAAVADASEVATAAIEAARDRLAVADAWSRYEAALNRPQSSDATLRQYQIGRAHV